MATSGDFLMAADMVAPAALGGLGKLFKSLSGSSNALDAQIAEAAGGATRGGAGPVAQGRAGVDAYVADLESSGGRVLGREITLDVNGVRTRVDLYVQYPDGTTGFVEVKTGSTAGLTPNQEAAYPGVRAGGAVPAGARADQAGLPPGVALPATDVAEVHLPWPLP